MAKDTDIIDTMTSDEFLASIGIVIEPAPKGKRKNTKEANDVVGDVDDFLSSLGL